MLQQLFEVDGVAEKCLKWMALQQLFEGDGVGRTW